MGGFHRVRLPGSGDDPETYARDITTFVRSSSGGWQRDDERHVNVLVHAPHVVRLLADEGVEAEIARGFDDGQRLEEGLVAIPGCDANRRDPASNSSASMDRAWPAADWRLTPHIYCGPTRDRVDDDGRRTWPSPVPPVAATVTVQMAATSPTTTGVGPGGPNRVNDPAHMPATLW